MTVFHAWSAVVVCWSCWDKKSLSDRTRVRERVGSIEEALLDSLGELTLTCLSYYNARYLLARIVLRTRDYTGLYDQDRSVFINQPCCGEQWTHVAPRPVWLRKSSLCHIQTGLEQTSPGNRKQTGLCLCTNQSGCEHPPYIAPGPVWIRKSSLCHIQTGLEVDWNGNHT
jgi:hypothetical protein